MQAPACRAIHLDDFPRGIDNLRVDVSLDRKFLAAAKDLVSAVLREDVQRHLWRQSVAAPNVNVAEVFSKHYHELSSMVVMQAREAMQPERVTLYQLAVFRLLITLVDAELHALREQLNEEREHPGRQLSGEALELYDRAVLLARYEEHIRSRALKTVLRLVLRSEHSSLSKTRENVLGIAWPLPKSMLSAPSLQLGGKGSDEEFIKFFPYLLFDDAKSESLLRHVFEVLQDWLPEGLFSAPMQGDSEYQEPTGDYFSCALMSEAEHCAPHLLWGGEHHQREPHVFDDADAVVGLFGGAGNHWPSLGDWGDRRLLSEFKRRFKRLKRRLVNAGLEREMRASVVLGEIYTGLGVRHCIEPIYAYLLGDITRRQLSKRLVDRLGQTEATGVVARIEERLKRLGRPTPQRRRQQLLQVVQDALRYRYQWKLVNWLLRGMQQVHVLQTQQELEMSRANGLLHEFSLSPGGAAADEKNTFGHVIVKADIRGSTEITALMQARNLNPAAYFSRNFYDPITELLRSYGAEKVFVEGDAIILAVLETSKVTQSRFAVARACGLALHMLQVLERKNAESRRVDLPTLELGVGIAYSNVPPNYLFDGGHRIMISSAINRADRLSSCHAELRRLFRAQGVESGVEVVFESDEGEASMGTGNKLQRFNVNGVELEPAAFYRLGATLNMHRLRLSGEQGTFHVARYPDLQGKTHWVMVREAPLRRLSGGQVLAAEAAEERRFYQVVTAPELRERIRRRFASA